MGIDSRPAQAGGFLNSSQNWRRFDLPLGLRRTRMTMIARCAIICLMSTKDILLEIANKLPADATLADALYELEFRAAVEQGLAELDRGEGIPLDEVKKRLPQWLGK